jgi:hypothetical protein
VNIPKDDEEEISILPQALHDAAHSLGIAPEVLLFLLLGTVSHERRVLHRREYRYYLTRSALLQSPRGETAWNVLRHQRIEKT